MLPEVEEFFKTGTDSNEYYNEQARISNAHPVPLWRESWNEEERAKFYEADKARKIALMEFEHEWRERRSKALDALKNHSDPVVKWLATDRVIQRDYTGYRDQVLKSLPMNREQMDSFGDRQGWCGDYARMLERAERAGVLPAPTPELANIDALVKELRDYWGGTESRFRNVIKSHLPAILESAAKMQAEREAAEKAAHEEATKVLAESLAGNSTRDESAQEAVRADRARDERGRFAAVTVAA